MPADLPAVRVVADGGALIAPQKTRRRPTWLPVLVSVALAAGCTSRAPAPTAPGCGWVPAAEVVGLLGADVAAREVGSPAVLREQRTRIRCRTTVPGHPERFVAIEAEHHPRPLKLPPTSCSAGWVYAGTADKFAPACQDSADGHGRTQLFVRWQPYVVRVTIGRADRSWAGDPEAALRMSRALAQRLGVRAASGEG